MTCSHRKRKCDKKSQKHKSCHCNDNNKEVKQICQVPSTLTDAIQVPDMVKFGNGGGLLSQDFPFISKDGKLIYTIYITSPNVNGVAQAELFQNVNNGTFNSIAKILPDNFALGLDINTRCGGNSGTSGGGTDTGGASPDFSLFSILDDDTFNQENNLIAGNLRIRVFDQAGLVSGTPQGTIIFSDFSSSSGSANGGIISNDNKYLVFNYISTNGTATKPVLKVIPISLFKSGLTVCNPVVPTIEIDGFSNGPNLVTLNGVLYIALGFQTIASFTDTLPIPPFGFAIYKFDVVALSLVFKSVPFARAPNVSLTKLSEDVVRIAAVSGQYTFNANSCPPVATTTIAPFVPSVGSNLIIADAPDTNNFQVFDFTASTGSIVKIFSENYEGSLLASWIPASNGTALLVSQRISGRLEKGKTPPDCLNRCSSKKGDCAPTAGFDSATYFGTAVTFALILNEDDCGNFTAIQVGTLHHSMTTVNGPVISEDSQWFVTGTAPITPLGYDKLPSFGFPNVLGTVNQFLPYSTCDIVGFYTLLLYKLDYPAVAKCDKKKDDCYSNCQKIFIRC